MAAVKKQVTFKDNERENRLARIVESHYSQSGFIKDAIEFYDNYQNQKRPEQKRMQAVRF